MAGPCSTSRRKRGYWTCAGTWSRRWGSTPTSPPHTVIQSLPAAAFSWILSCVSGGARSGDHHLWRWRSPLAGETPILVATEAEGDEAADIVPVLRYLLDRGGDPAAPDDKGYTPLHNAAEHGALLALCLRNFVE